MSTKTFILCLFSLLSIGDRVEAQQIHALLVGIDHYHARSDIAPLDGAVADARDIAAALSAVGASTITILLNDDASRESIFTAWETLKKAAKPGDTLLFTYAGHGGQEPERVASQERDSLDETLILGAFTETAPNNRQRIFDDELRAMIAEAADFNVIMVFDSCNSGTANRSAAFGQRRQRVRAARYGPIVNDAAPPPRGTASEPPPGTLAHETFVAGAKDGNYVFEITIDGQSRGALSYFFARAIRGAADLNRDGTLLRRELRRYLLNNIQLATEGLQEATVAYVDGAGDVPLFLSPLAATPPADTTAPPLLLAVDDLGEISSETIYKTLRHVTPVAATSDADLTWRFQEGIFINKFNDLAAQLADESTRRGVAPQLVKDLPGSDIEVTASKAQGVIDKWRVLPLLKNLAGARPLSITLAEGNGLHRLGTRLNLSIEPRRYAPLTIVNLASTGIVQYLYPLEKYGDDPAPTPQQRFDLFSIEVAEPFGADHIVALSGPGDQNALREALQTLDTRPAALELQQMIHQAVKDGIVKEIGLYGFYTAK